MLNITTLPIFSSFTSILLAITISSCSFEPLQGDILAEKLGEIKTIPAPATEEHLASTLPADNTQGIPSFLSQGLVWQDSTMGKQDEKDPQIFHYNVTNTPLSASITLKEPTTSGENKDIQAITIKQGEKSFSIPTEALVTSPKNIIYQNLPQTVYVRFNGKAPNLNVLLFCGDGENSCDVVYTFNNEVLIQRTITQGSDNKIINYGSQKQNTVAPAASTETALVSPSSPTTPVPASDSNNKPVSSPAPVPITL